MNDAVRLFRKGLKRRMSLNEFDLIQHREERNTRRGSTHNVVLMGKYTGASPTKHQGGPPTM